MATKYFALLTNIGAAKLANATALGAQVEITQMAVGDGNGALPTPSPAQTALAHEQRRAQLNMLTIDPVNTNQIIAEQVIPEDVGGWWIREIGLFDKDGDMIAIANCAETYKPQLQEGSGRVQVIRVILIVSNTEAVTLKIDPSVVLATRKYVDDAVIEVKAYADDVMKKHVDAANPHKQYSLIANALKELADAGLADEALENLGIDTRFSGRILRVKKIVTSQLYEWPDDVAEIDVAIVGGGGGGGGGSSVPAGYCSAGSGGGGGGSARSRYKKGDIPLSVQIEVGAGGKGGIANGAQPTSGGNTKFGSLMLAGGGSRAANGIAFQQTGASMLIGNGGGGQGSGGNLFSGWGGSGTPAIFLSNGYESGAGGDSMFSFGPPPLTTNTSLAGYDGMEGAGGGGAVIIENTAGKNGGNGGDGVCLIVEYSV